MLGKVQIQKVSPQHLQKLYNQKLEEGYAPQTVKHIHRVLHRALGDALRWQLVARNICDAVDPPRVPKKEMQALSGEQAQQFLEAAGGDPLEALYVLALTTGMRQGELLERRSSNGELTKRGKTWLSQEKRRSKQSYATPIMATSSGIIGKRRTSGQTRSQGETLRVLAEISSPDLG